MSCGCEVPHLTGVTLPHHAIIKRVLHSKEECLLKLGHQCCRNVQQFLKPTSTGQRKGQIFHEKTEEN